MEKPPEKNAGGLDIVVKTPGKPAAHEGAFGYGSVAFQLLFSC
jgi:hypothetical protein